MGLNVKSEKKRKNLENTGENLWDTRSGKEFLDVMLKTQSIKGETDRSGFTKIKNFTL